MKKKIFIVLYIILLLVFGRQLLNYCYNEHVVQQYLSGDYSVNDNLLLSLNLIEPYIAHYNNGNILYKNHLYDEAIEEYQAALDCPGIPQRRECSIRINYALSLIGKLPDDYDSAANIPTSLETLYQARNILLEDGCATEDGKGHSTKAERLKREIDRMIEDLESKSTGTLHIAKTITGCDDLSKLDPITFTVVGPEEFATAVVSFDANSTLWVQQGDTYVYTINEVPAGDYVVTETANGENDLYSCSTEVGTESSVTLPPLGDVTAEFTNEYTENPQQQNPQQPQDPQNPQDPQDPQDPQNPQDPQDPQNPQDPQQPQDPQNPQDPQQPQQPQDPQNPQNPQDPQQDPQHSDPDTQQPQGTEPTNFEDWEEQVRQQIEDTSDQAARQRQTELQDYQEYDESSSNWSNDYEGIW